VRQGERKDLFTSEKSRKLEKEKGASRIPTNKGDGRRGERKSLGSPGVAATSLAGRGVCRLRDSKTQINGYFKCSHMERRELKGKVGETAIILGKRGCPGL